VTAWALIKEAVLGPPAWPRHPFALARFGLQAMRSADRLATGEFQGTRARGLFAGIAAHAMLPLEMLPSGAVALVLGALAHTAGWLFPRGGTQRLADALASHLRLLGGEIVTSARVNTIEELPPARAILCDLSPRPFLRFAGRVLPDKYKARLARYRYGMGVYKVDWALDGPIPWRAAECARAGTVHLGGTLAEIASAERASWNGEHAERPFVLVGQQSLFDPTRAPAGKHTAWAYCHVPNGSRDDRTEAIEAQIERFAPGFRKLILARSVRDPAALESDNRNYLGGDINGGTMDLPQLLFRPRPSVVPWRTPRRGVYLCSAATPPGGGVHGLSGYAAARVALRDLSRRNI
jgi:phytoene dehydrogenase-like protein